jgi:hypothetical protein
MCAYHLVCLPLCLVPSLIQYIVICGPLQLLVLMVFDITLLLSMTILTIIGRSHFATSLVCLTLSQISLHTCAHNLAPSFALSKQIMAPSFSTIMLNHYSRHTTRFFVCCVLTPPSRTAMLSMLFVPSTTPCALLSSMLTFLSPSGPKP